MKRHLALVFAAFLLIACGDEKKEKETESTETEMAALAFETSRHEMTSEPCEKDKCTRVTIEVPNATGEPAIADSINNGIFKVVRSIVYFGEKPTDTKSYNEMMVSFIQSYDEMKRKFPDEAIAWEAKIKGSVDYETDSLINVKINNYMFVGGAHGYEGDRSLFFDPETGKTLQTEDLFTDIPGLTALAETKFRDKYKIAKGKPINSTGLFFPDEAFILPSNIFFKEDGILLFYNSAEIGSFADGQKELLIPYSEAAPYLKRK